MKFITKEEFDKAVETIELALKTGQVRFGHYNEAQDVMTNLLFCDSNPDNGVIAYSRVFFVSPEQAIKERLLEVRQILNAQRKESQEKHKTLEDLEKTEKVLAAELASLKE